tara:strand:+ start:34 stop:1230 length:1197 start_codon:yes stop_codon:yes gene_type:complete
MSEDKRPRIKGQAEMLGRPDDRNVNRSLEFRNDEDISKELNIGLYDHDDAISYYFDNIIRPSVVEDGNVIQVPVLYGSPERWRSVQKGYYFRDQKGKIQVPLIMYRRTSVEKDRNLTNKLDGNNPRNFSTLEKKYTPRNNYDQFSILNGMAPQKEFRHVVVPDYVKLSYECIIWTDYVEHMNKIVEAVNYAEGSYWGVPEQFKFMATIDNFQTTNDTPAGGERTVKTTFNLNIKGYLVPDALQKELAKQNIKKSYSMSRLKWGFEVEEDKVAKELGLNDKPIQASTGAGSTSKGSKIVTNSIVFSYLATNIEKIADTVSGTTATFNNAGFKQAPIYSGLPDTSVSDFSIHVNGQFVDRAAIVSFTEVGSNVVLVIDDSVTGWQMQPDYTVVAIGKFES